MPQLDLWSSVAISAEFFLVYFFFFLFASDWRDANQLLSIQNTFFFSFISVLCLWFQNLAAAQAAGLVCLARIVPKE